MMTLLATCIRGISKLSASAFTFAMLLVPLLVLLTLQQVISRYFFQVNSIALQELQWHLFGFIITLSIAHTLQMNQHVRVDILSTTFSSRIKNVIHITGFLCLIPLALTLASFGIDDVMTARNYTTPTPPSFYSEMLFGIDSAIFPIANTLENFLRATVLLGESSSDAGGLEARWIIKCAFPVGMILLALQSFALLLLCMIPTLREACSTNTQWLD
ncbi:TRAP transporter small permease subunit [bacterium]|nr:TRAP transporter small permease subunit [bacterium]